MSSWAEIQIRNRALQENSTENSENRNESLSDTISAEKSSKTHKNSISTSLFELFMI